MSILIPSKKISSVWLGLLLCIGWLVLAARPLAAQGYILESGDRISISFWQDPTLNTETEIRSDGKILMPVIGEITAAGLTVSQLAKKIADRMRLLNPNVNQALVKVVEYGSKKIYVTGAVYTPGPHTFEKMPNVWQAIQEAGGPTEAAALDKVIIIRGGETSGQTIPVDLTSYFEQGDFTRLPELRPNDNIYVPTRTGAAAGAAAAGGGAGPAAGGGGLFVRRSVVYVYGSVMAPGAYELEKGMDVLQALIRAGGPTTVQNANRSGPTQQPDLRSVRLITHSDEGPVVYEIDLEQYAREGHPQPLLLKAGDTIYVPVRQSVASFVFSNAMRTAITGTVSILISYLLLNQILK